MAVGNSIAVAIERVVAPVEGMQEHLASRWFEVMGPVGRRAGVVYAAGSRAVYGSIRVGARAIGGVIDAVRPGGHTADDAITAWVNGLWGDDLGQGAGLDSSMSVRDLQGRPVETGPSVASAFRDATGHLVVLVHGLVDTEKAWRDTDSQSGLVAELAKHPELTPVLVRYNTGLKVEANATSLAVILEDLVAAWPVRVESIALVGHSMGGLVAGSAMVFGRRNGQHWVEYASKVIAIGAPYRGAPLARLAEFTAAGLAVAATTRPLADFLNRRSGGIKDLAPGDDGDLDSYAAPLPGFHTIAGVFTNDPQHPVGRMVGDLMVRPSSAAPSGSASESTVVVGGVNHFDMLRNRTVIDQIIDWVIPGD